MAANQISMPLRGTRDAPKFDGKTPAQLPRFLEDVEILGDAAGITEEAKIKAAIRYADLEEAEVWETLDAASGAVWADFVTAVKDLYPGCEGVSRFCRADLQYLVYEYSQKPMRSQDDLGEYRRKFIKISAHLVTAKKLAETERDALFLSGFPQDVADRVRHRLSIVKSDLHPDDAYPIEDVMKAAKFLLTGSALRTPIPTNNEYRSVPPSVPQPPTGTVVKQEYAFQAQRPVGRPSVCAFCAHNGHFIGSCEHVGEYLQAGKIIRGTDGRLYMPDGSGIPRYPGTNCMKAAIDRMEAEKRGSIPVATSAAFVRDPPPHMTAGILSLTYPEVDVEVEVEPSAFLNTVDELAATPPYIVADPEFQPYFANAWASFQANKAGKEGQSGKRVRFDGVQVPPKTFARGGGRQATVSEEIESPEVQATRQSTTTSAAPSRTTAPTSSPGIPASKPSSSVPPPPTQPATAGADSSRARANFPPATQYRYTFALEDDTAPQRVLDRVLEASIPVPVKDLFAVSPDFRKHFRDVTTTKRVTSTGVVQVNELSGRDPGSVSREYGDRLHTNDDGLIVAHHSLPLRCLEAKVNGTERAINCVLDSGSEIVALPKRVWEELGLPIRSDHVMTMSSANASTDATLGVLENLRLDFGAGDVCVQVQVIGRSNFDILLGRPFHCLMSATTNDFPDGSQNITLRDPNTGKEYKLPTRPWTEGCPRCKRGIHCSNHQSVVEMGF
jgi:hypothetical protein